MLYRTQVRRSEHLDFIRSAEDASRIFDNRFDNRLAGRHGPLGWENTMDFHAFSEGAARRTLTGGRPTRRPKSIIKAITRDSSCVIGNSESAHAPAVAPGLSDNRFDNRLGRHNADERSIDSA